MNKLPKLERIPKLSAEVAILPFFIARDAGGYTRDVVDFAKTAGGYAVQKLTEVYQGKPIDQPHIVDRIKAEIAVTDAEVGRGLVGVADKLEGQSKAARKKGHSLISTAALDAKDNEDVNPEATQEVVAIANEAETNPLLLDDSVMSSDMRQQAAEIIDQG